MTETLIKVDGVSKKFCRGLRQSLWYGLQDLGNELRGKRHGGNGQLRADEFWAVRDVSFELSRGECLGLIGHNGAGKTTLLRMLNGLIKPDQGRIEIRGRVGALIALGAGFNPVLTGRENIYTNASVLGLSKREVDVKLDEIIDFSEIGEFIDTPVQNYSSGMSVRLGFSVAAVLIEPDVLFLDEVLAVGDIGFVIKCLNSMRRLTADSAVVFVSHNMQFISEFCTRVMVMTHGATLLDSPNPAEGIDRYFALVKHEQQISGTGEAQVLDLDLRVNGELLAGEEPSIPQGSSATAVLRLHVNGPRACAHAWLYIHDEAMVPLICTPIHDASSRMLCLAPGEHLLELPLGVMELNAGKYSFIVAILDARTSIVLARVAGVQPFRVLADQTHWAKVVRPAVPQLKSLPKKTSTLSDGGAHPSSSGRGRPMTNKPIHVTQPYLPPLDEFIPYLTAIWDSKILTNSGPFHERFEKELCEYLGVKHLAVLTNGTIALVTALQALRITGEVITTPYSFVATAHSLLWNGIKPVFVDIDPNTLNLDPSKIEAAITPQTTAILPVHCYGHPCDVNRIQKIADNYGLKVIYDAAHAFGVQCHGGSVLNYGDLSVLSFHATKVFTTFEGGAIVCPDAKSKQRIDHLKNFGYVDEVTVVAPGINGKMSEFNAALGLLQLKYVDGSLARRKEIDAIYRERLRCVKGIHCLRDAGENVANYAYFPILVQPEYPLNREELYLKLRDNGIYARRYFHPLISDFPMYRALPSAARSNLPVASKAASEVICLPIHPALNAEHVESAITIITGSRGSQFTPTDTRDLAAAAGRLP